MKRWKIYSNSNRRGSSILWPMAMSMYVSDSVAVRFSDNCNVFIFVYGAAIGNVTVSRMRTQTTSNRCICFSLFLYSFLTILCSRSLCVNNFSIHETNREKANVPERERELLWRNIHPSLDRLNGTLVDCSCLCMCVDMDMDTRMFFEGDELSMYGCISDTDTYRLFVIAIDRCSMCASVYARHDRNAIEIVFVLSGRVCLYTELNLQWAGVHRSRVHSNNAPTQHQLCWA